MGIEQFNAPVGMLKRQPSQLEGDLPFEPVTLTFRCENDTPRRFTLLVPAACTGAYHPRLNRGSVLCMAFFTGSISCTSPR